MEQDPTIVCSAAAVSAHRARALPPAQAFRTEVAPHKDIATEAAPLRGLLQLPPVLPIPVISVTRPVQAAASTHRADHPSHPAASAAGAGAEAVVPAADADKNIQVFIFRIAL